ncbi:MAG: MBL fold metallo-hydrolase, partial [Spirochaetes bacterium]|nr:MBL fold metallo-hydrolase [Spirochaetota bacterium]
MKIVTLIEDKVVGIGDGKNEQNLISRHGLSLYIESNGLKILFDTGPDSSIINNAEQLEIDLSEIDFAVISHGHYDHGGGVPAFCRVNSAAPVYLHKKSYLDSHFSQHPGGSMKNADFVIDQKDFNRLVPVDNLPSKRREGVYAPALSGNVLLITGFPKEGYIPAGNKNLFSQETGKDIVHDDFSHEIAMLIRDSGKNILFTGCSHSGVGNMMKRASEILEGDSIDYVIGGFHLIDTERNRANRQKDLQVLVDELTAYPGTQFYTGHCTGKTPLQFLQQKLGETHIHV